MIDFTSALYLGLRHPAGSLQPWRELTTGVPAALSEPLESRAVAVRLARLQGFAAGALAPSTLHLAWDVFGLLSHEPITVHMDAGAYTISRWGAARARLRGARVGEFRHHDVEALHAQMKNDPGATRPVVVTDGFCPACGRPAPLGEYLACVRQRGGWLVADDTQALGILGRAPTPVTKFGSGGGGSFRWSDVHGPDVIVFASLAKAFGVPIAVVAGSADWIDRFKRHSGTRVHCSPPSAAVVSAATHALTCNHAVGDDLRRTLEQRVRQFRRELVARGLSASGGLFPVQTLALPDVRTGATVRDQLHQRGIAVVLIKGEAGQPRLSFLITARHTPQEIETAARATAETAGRNHPPLLGTISTPGIRTTPWAFPPTHHQN